MVYLSIVIPIYNEELIVKELVNRLNNELIKINSNYEIIFVDDGSTDQSWKRVLESNIENAKVKGLKLSRNFGHHYAITAGLNKSKGDWVVVMDGDLQDRPEVISKLHLKALEGFDVVFVSRANRPEGFFYKILQRIFYILLNFLSGQKFDSTQANFSIINRRVVEAFKDFPEQARFYSSTIKWLGFTRASIEADHGRRLEGKPSYTFKKRVKLATDIIIAYSDRPLKFAIGLGLILSAFSLILSAWVIIGYFNWGFTVIGWPSLIASILFIGGINMIILGIMGAYISRIFQEVKRRPLYIIKDELK